ncbi:MAG: MurR/RpiR family transcriptional regulator [Phycisphaerales bacterium]|nr:MurR/RpiR family transcriptional regulator [Phycisphaerales bacterium]
MSIEELIASVNDRLTPTERRIAEAVAADPSLLAFGTVSDLADRVGASPPSIVRFAAKLGFGGFRDLQSRARDGVSRQLASRPGHRVRQPHGSVAPVRGAVLDAVQATFETLDEPTLEAIAQRLVQARNVWILSGETARVGAQTLRSGLAMVRPHVTLVEEHDVGRDLSDADSDDAAVVFDFARYRRSSTTAARMLAKLDVEIIAITDGPLSPLASLARTWVGLGVPAVGPFDSSVPAVIAAELIVAEVVHQLGDTARERIDQLETLWEATGTFLRYTPRREHRPRTRTRTR